MDRDQDFVTVAVNSHRVVIVFVFIDSWGELDVNVLRDSCRNHALLLVPDLEVAGLWGHDVESLRCGGVIDETKFHCVRFICLEACKFDYAGRRTKNAIRPDCVIHVLLGNTNALVSFSLGNEAPLNLNLVLTVWRRLASQTLFKMVTPLVINVTASRR